MEKSMYLVLKRLVLTAKDFSVILVCYCQWEDDLPLNGEYSMKLFSRIKLAYILNKLEDYADTSKIDGYAITEAYEALKTLKSRGTQPEGWSDELTMFNMLSRNGFIPEDAITPRGLIIMEANRISEI